jgi:hypothetical protein
MPRRKPPQKDNQMADAKPVAFTVETPKDQKAKAAQVVAETREPEAVVAAGDREPRSGDTFVPVRGKHGVYQALPGDFGLNPPMVTIVRH